MIVGLPPMSRTVHSRNATLRWRSAAGGLLSHRPCNALGPSPDCDASPPVQLSQRDATLAFWCVSAAIDRHRHRAWSSERDGAAAEGRSGKIDPQGVIVMRRKRRRWQTPRRTAERSSSVLDDRASLPNEGLFAPSTGTSQSRANQRSAPAWPTDKPLPVCYSQRARMPSRILNAPLQAFTSCPFPYYSTHSMTLYTLHSRFIPSILTQSLRSSITVAIFEIL